MHHAQLDRLAGNWTAAVKFKVGPGAEQQSTATSEARWILGGRFRGMVLTGANGTEEKIVTMAQSDEGQ